MPDENPKSLEEQIEHNRQIAIEAMDAELQRRIREHEEAIREARILQRQMFNRLADRDVPESVKQEIKSMGLSI